jgi:hypothetical protein
MMKMIMVGARHLSHVCGVNNIVDIYDIVCVV